MPTLGAQPYSTYSYSFRARRGLQTSFHTLLHHLQRHVGVGIICSVAYFDPGNWSVDLQAGSSFGYRPMLFVVLLAGIGAIVLQSLACKLGCVTGLDLARHCRLLLCNRSHRPRLVRWTILYPLYVLSEIAIISTDLAELLGSAIGFCLLFPKLPLWGGVVFTAFDVLIFLFFSDPTHSQGRPVKTFEYTITALVFAVFYCFVALLVKASPDWSEVFMGYVPDMGFFQSNPDAVYSAVGILGATVMPHALFLGSSLATQDRVSTTSPQVERFPSPAQTQLPKTSKLKRLLASLFRFSRAERMSADFPAGHGEWENNSLTFVKQHLSHAIVDVISSLFVFAVPINSAILILAAAVFYKGPGGDNDAPAGLFEAHDLIKARLGSGAGLVFAIALVCAGQTSSVTVTLAGQIVSEGFIEWRVSPFLRRLITRCLSLIPSVIVAVAVGRQGINSLLVVSQVVLSIVLPFVAFPLIYLTSSEVVMKVTVPTPELDESDENEEADHQPNIKGGAVQAMQAGQTSHAPPKLNSTLDFSNGHLLAAASYIIWFTILVANGYAIAILFWQL